MKRKYYYRELLPKIAATAALLLLVGWAQNAQAQWSAKWLAVGRLHHPYLSGGAEPENLPTGDSQMFFPGIIPQTTYSHWKGLWVSAKNFTDETGKRWDIRTSHIGPRDLGLGEFFSTQFQLIARFESPAVYVDGALTFQRPSQVDVVDPNLGADRMVNAVMNTSIGVQVERRAQMVSNPYLDNFHIVEYIFTNTGNIDDDDEIELEGQTLEDVYFALMERPKVNAPSGSWARSKDGNAWGEMTMNDVIGDGEHDFGLDIRANISWMGESHNNEFSVIGNPITRNPAESWHGGIYGDSLGRLAGGMYGEVVLHADAHAHAPDATAPDDPAQPRTMTYIESDWSEITTGSSHNNEAKMAIERGVMERGSGATEAGSVAPDDSDPRTTPTHAWRVQPDGQFDKQTGLPSLGRGGGWGYMNAYGPYDMGPGEQVCIVVAYGVGSLDDHAAYVIGRTWKLAGYDDDLIIEYDANGDGVITDVQGWNWDNIFTGDEAMTKNQWGLSVRDSLLKVFEAAKLVWDSGFNHPKEPLPPIEFRVTSGSDKIELTWQPHPAGGPPRTGWEIYRAQKNYWGIPLALRVGDDGLAVVDSSTVYQLIASLGPNETSYIDSQVERGQSYFYYIQAVGEKTNAWGPIPQGAVLKSNRYYAQTFEPAFLRRAPGSSLSDVRIVPNPYYLGSISDVRFDVQDRIAFYGLPAKATIKIYSEIGELIKTLEHTDGSGDQFWDLTTYSRQLVVSGIYLAVVTDDETGEQVILKFIVIR